MRRRYGVDMPVRTVGVYLQRWGFTPQKPVKRAKERNPEAVERWLRTSTENSLTCEEGEGRDLLGRRNRRAERGEQDPGLWTKGKTPVLRVTAKRAHISMISAITNEGKVRFMVYRKAMTQAKLIAFMSRLIRDSGRKVYLILDNLKVHHGTKVAEWLEGHKEEIVVFYLPSYSPELNPDEYLNGDLKTRVHSGIHAGTESDLKHKTQSFMRMLVKRPHRVRSYFRHQMVAYAR